MKTKEAVEHVLTEHKITAYALADALGAFPQNVRAWQTGTRMSKPFADKFEELFNIKIKDVY